MTKIHNRTTNTTQREALRREMTKPERMIWALLRGKKLGAKFRRQHSVQEYILDFYCPQHRIALSSTEKVTSHRKALSTTNDARRF